MMGDELVERAFEILCAKKVIGLQVFALKYTEPDFDLIQPGRIGGQPEHPKMQSLATGAFLLTEPSFELLGSVRRAIIEDEGHRVDAPSQGFGNDLLLHKGLEIDKALALAADSIDLAIGDRESSEQMAGTATMVASFVEHRLAWVGGARRLLALACLDGRFSRRGRPARCLLA